MNRPIKLFLLCPGLGHVKRGFESFTRECFDALRADPDLDITLFKGGEEPTEREVVLANFPRNRPGCEALGKAFGKSGYIVEQATFGLSLLPHLARHRPDVIFLSDFCLGHYLWHWRHRCGGSYKILFSNGGPTTPPYHHWDHVHQVVPSALQEAAAAGEPPEKQSLVPYGIQIPSRHVPLPDGERLRLREKLGLPRDRPVLLSIGIVNESYKRMDYVVREVATLDRPRPFLALLGQQDEETARVRALAESLLGTHGFQILTVAKSEVSEYYLAANVFILASVAEGFGRVLIEAQSRGLPCLAHDYPVARFVLGREGYYGDFRRPGSLTGLIRQALAEGGGLPARHARHQYAYERFSWERLRPQYVDMIRRTAA